MPGASGVPPPPPASSNWDRPSASAQGVLKDLMIPHLFSQLLNEQMIGAENKGVHHSNW